MENIWTTQNGTKINVKGHDDTAYSKYLKCIESGKILFVVSLGYEEDNDYETFDENIGAKERWIKIFKEELDRRKEL